MDTEAGGTAIGTAALWLLAAELESKGFEAVPVMRRANAIRVTNRRNSRLSDQVVCHAGSFWWPWEPPVEIGPSSDIGGAARGIERVLAITRDHG